MNKGQMDRFIAWILGGLIVLGVLYFFPWGDITWGRVIMKNEGVVTVTGYAESDEKNQIAMFSAGVTALNDEKQVAVNEVNTKMAAIIKEVKSLGIDAKDIQTQQLSVYQMQETVDRLSPEMMPIGGGSKVKLGQWSASNTIQITIRNVEKASELADVLNKSGANNVYGPNFQLDTSKKAEDALLSAAVADAKNKAEVMAAASGAKLGRVVSIVESGQGTIYPMMARSEMAKDISISAPLEAGTTKISKTVSVVFGLR